VTLRATDLQGSVGTTTVAIDVVDPPVDSLPIVSILQPTPGATLNANLLQALEAGAFDPDGTAITGFRRTVESVVPDILAETEIGTGAGLDWTPRGIAPSLCGTGREVVVRCCSTDETGATLPFVGALPGG